MCTGRGSVSLDDLKGSTRDGPAKDVSRASRIGRKRLGRRGVG